MNLFTLQNEKRWLAASVQLPQEEVSSVGAGALGLTEEGKENLLFAGIWWQLVITAMMQWNMN